MTETRKTALAAKEAERKLCVLSADEKNKALNLIADALDAHKPDILESNARDTAKARENGMSDSLLDRLTLTEARIAAIAQGARDVAALPDPIGEVLSETVRPNGLRIQKVRVPIGVIGMIYEARPNVTVDCAALAIKSGNAIVLRGSASALCSNITLVKIIKDALSESGVPCDSVGLITDTTHDGANEMMCMTDAVDVLIPRGGANLINSVIANAKVPVIRTGVGNCHIFVDDTADPDMAARLCINSKAQRPSTCNAAETLLISRGYKHAPELLSALCNVGITVHGDDEICALCSAEKADEEDFAREYLSLDIAAKFVSGVDEAIEHIARYGTGHTELIITANAQNAEKFMNEVDAACVNCNASTRFTDGGQFGFGAEIGIATQKLHARGPLGLAELTIYKYKVYGNGQERQ